MLKTGVRNCRQQLRRSGFIPTSIRSPTIPYRLYTSRNAKIPPSRPPRRTYSHIFTLVAASLTGALVLYGVKWKTIVPYGIIHADADASSPPPSEDKEPPKQEPRDYTTETHTYPRSFWDLQTKSLEEHLAGDSQIYSVDIPCGISRYDVCALTNGSFIGCFSSTYFIDLPSHYWVFIGMHDGHNGGKMASHLAHNLQHALMETLISLYSEQATLPNAHIDLGGSPENMHYWSGVGSGRPYPPPEDFDAAIKQAILNMDNEVTIGSIQRALEAAQRFWVNEPEQDTQENLLSYEDAAELVSRAHSGSSNLVAVYESDTRQLRVANTGDSRAILGRRVVNDRGEEVYDVHILTRDMPIPSGFPEDPPKRVQKHAGAMYALGDGPWKWDAELRQQLRNAFPFITGHEPSQIPVSAEPVVTTIEVQPGDFLVMANQGLWSSLTNEEAVGLVGLWLKRYRKIVFGNLLQEPKDNEIVSFYDPEISSMMRSPSQPPAVASTMSSILRKDVFEREDLPVRASEKKDDTFMHRMWGVPKKFVNMDRNVAQHLVRNALGGGNRDVTEALVAMNFPRSRRYRDDISVEVVFFN